MLAALNQVVARYTEVRIQSGDVAAMLAAIRAQGITGQLQIDLSQGAPTMMKLTRRESTK